MFQNAKCFIIYFRVQENQLSSTDEDPNPSQKIFMLLHLKVSWEYFDILYHMLIMFW